jgi:Mg-chelatase subunit ChlD
MNTHIYLLLDRSGSMESMASDVIGGFNSFLAEQQADGADARITLVQFDSQDPQEIVIDARPITAAAQLTADTFRPRGGTPLLDATGTLITRASARAEQRKTHGKKPEHVVFVTITDGEENQSRQYTREHIKTLIRAHEAAGWTFVFLGAGLDAYAEAGSIGVDARSVQAYAADGTGAKVAFAATSAAMVKRRQDVRAGAPLPAPADFFGGQKLAEDDKNRRGA